MGPKQTAEGREGDMMNTAFWENGLSGRGEEDRMG